jgi:SAM-dependent methyltransferase
MCNKNLLRSFNKLTSPNIEYELHIGRYDPHTYRYSSLISKESFNKILGLTKLFDAKKTDYTISKVENCVDRDIRAVTTYYEGNNNSAFNKSAFSNKEPTFEKKKTINTFFLEGTAIKISIATEDPATETKIKKGKYRLKRRISKYSKDGLWRFDFTYVYFDLNTNTPNITNREPSYSLEIEYIHPTKKNAPDPQKYLKSLKDILPHILENIPEVKQPLNMRIINKVLKKFNQDYKNPKDRLQNQDITTVNMNGGFMNQVVPLEQSSFQYIVTNHAVTEKADGERYFLYIDDDGKCYQIAKSKEVIDLEVTHKMKNALLDCEYIPSLKKYMAFDVLIHGDKDVSREPLATRVKDIAKYNLSSKATIIIQEKKQHIPTEKTTVFDLSKKVYKAKYPYELDGLIYTPVDKGYFNKVYKWKPQKMNTVDFLFRETPMNKDEYFVFSSISQYVFKQRHFKLDDTYKKLFPEYVEKIQHRKLKFFPYYFSSQHSDKVVKKSDLTKTEQKLLKDNVILECALDTKLKIWIPERARDDKTDIYLQSKKEGQFRGPNGWGVAESTLKLITDPITEKMILNGVYNSKLVNYYQQGEDSNHLRLIKKYHNHIKAYLYKKYIKGGSIIEIAGGRGGDLFKLNHSKVDFLLLTDLSQDALDEAKKRYKKMKTKMEVKIMQGDFNNDLVDKIKSQIEPRTEVDNIACQFAFHYFLKNKSTLENVFRNINTFLKKGGYFIFTTFDGKEINNKVKNGNMELKKNDKTIVRIKKKYNSNTLQNLGQEVDVYVESIGNHPEYLVNYEYIMKYFTDNGYKIIESELFSKKFNELKELNNVDKKFSGLNRYNVLEKL